MKLEARELALEAVAALEVACHLAAQPTCDGQFDLYPVSYLNPLSAAVLRTLAPVLIYDLILLLGTESLRLLYPGLFPLPSPFLSVTYILYWIRSMDFPCMGAAG